MDTIEKVVPFLKYTSKSCLIDVSYPLEREQYCDVSVTYYLLFSVGFQWFNIYIYIMYTIYIYIYNNKSHVILPWNLVFQYII